MQLIQEAGVVGIFVVAVFVAGLAARLSGKSTSTTPWALSLLALGQIGQSMAQHTVADAIQHVKSGDEALIVAIGSAEASSNLLLAGACALLLVVIGAAKDAAKDRA